MNVNVGLERAPSGCVIWINVNPRDLELKPFWWYGEAPGKPLLSMRDFRFGKQPRGEKRDRLSVRSIPQSKFTRLDTVAEIVQKLFGELEVKDV